MVSYRTCGGPILLVLVVLNSAARADWCEGRDPIEHDDGRYRFTSESWVRNRDGAVFYGRCIKVLPPTTKLRNDWIGVLPPGIAREDRPTKGGRSFPDDRTEDRSADLYYGNADDNLLSTYLAHHDEPSNIADSESPNSSVWQTIKDTITKFGELRLESVFSSSFYVD